MSVSEVLFNNVELNLNMSLRPCDVFYIRQAIDATSCTEAQDKMSSAGQVTAQKLVKV